MGFVPAIKYRPLGNFFQQADGRIYVAYLSQLREFYWGMLAWLTKRIAMGALQSGQDLLLRVDARGSVVRHESCGKIQCRGSHPAIIAAFSLKGVYASQA
jgi:hypothetical protein